MNKKSSSKKPATKPSQVLSSRQDTKGVHEIKITLDKLCKNHKPQFSLTKRLSSINFSEKKNAEKANSSLEKSNDILKLCSKTLVQFLKPDKRNVQLPQKKLHKGFSFEESLAQNGNRKSNGMHSTVISQVVSSPVSVAKQSLTIKPTHRNFESSTLFNHRLSHTASNKDKTSDSSKGVQNNVLCKNGEKIKVREYSLSHKQTTDKLSVLKERVKRIMDICIKKQKETSEENRRLRTEVARLRSILAKNNITLS
eukprot:TRINITY_DN11373_c0_g2_i4.p2 TRINITY_DN11373_c0_g2~~TRINITY_DN11373_c0_g2_i4.p2  ORF type:complete len:254 (+),score=52.37 TRINITY_DN11373_c0_g2_i4:122-883(+)